MALAVAQAALRDAIANAVADNVKAYDVAEVCTELLNLAPPKNEHDDPFASKRIYVGVRLKGKSIEQLTELARKVIAEYDDQELAAFLSRLGAHGVSGELKNLIFAADGPKPRVVLRDAINNVIEVVENAQHCLIYGQPLAESGLTWQELIGWWSEISGEDGDARTLGLSLYRRLARSLDNDAEMLVFRTYCKRYSSGSFDVPALIPQVYLHYDPHAPPTRAPTRRRWPASAWTSSCCCAGAAAWSSRSTAGSTTPGATVPPIPALCRMIREDRHLRLEGYEVSGSAARSWSTGRRRFRCSKHSSIPCWSGTVSRRPADATHRWIAEPSC